jgi:hypothetical protein
VKRLPPAAALAASLPSQSAPAAQRPPGVRPNILLIRKTLESGAATLSLPDVRRARGPATPAAEIIQADRRTGMLDVVVSRRR